MSEVVIDPKVGWRGTARRIIAVTLAALALAAIMVAVESVERGGIGWLWPEVSAWLISVLE